MNNWNNYNNSYGSYGSRYPSNTNVQYVTSLEEALSRSNTPNTENVYFHQDAQIFYRVKVDYDGRKYWQEFSYDGVKTPENNKPITQADLTNIVERLNRIEEYVFQEVEVPPNE